MTDTNEQGVNEPGLWEKHADWWQDEFTNGVDAEYEEQIKANQPAWLFFTNLAPSYKRDSIWWVMSAKKEETRLRRLGILIASSEAGLKIPTLRKKQ